MTAELYDIEFRKQILKLLLSDLEFSIKFLPLLKEEYFKEYSLQIIFKAIQSLRQRSEDLVEIGKTELRSEIYDLCSVRGIPTDEIIQDVDDIYSSSKVNTEIIKEKLINWIRKERVVEALKQSIDRVKSGNIDEIKNIIEKAFDINVGDDYGFIFQENYPEFIAKYRERYAEDVLIKTGFSEYDKALMGGYGRGEVHTIIAPPKLGKSTFATNVGFNVLKQQYAVVHITLELSEIDVMAKYFCLMTGFTYKELLTESQEEIDRRIHTFYSTYKPELFVKFFMNRTITIDNIKSYISSLRADKKITKKIGLIIVDYDDLLLPTSNARDQYEASGDIYFDLVKLAKYFDCPVLTLSQPRRDAWTKAYRGELVSSEDISHSAKKVHNAYSISTLTKTSHDGSSYILYTDMVRRGKSGIRINLKSDLDRAKFYTFVKEPKKS